MSQIVMVFWRTSLCNSIRLCEQFSGNMKSPIRMFSSVMKCANVIARRYEAVLSSGPLTCKRWGRDRCVRRMDHFSVLSSQRPLSAGVIPLKRRSTWTEYRWTLFYYPVREYRVKLDRSVLTAEQLMMKRVLKSAGLSFTDEYVCGELSEKLRLLTDAGCKSYEIADHPRMMLYTKQELVEFIRRFRSLNENRDLSVALLRFVTLDCWKSTAEKSICRYLQKFSGLSTTRVMDAFECSESEAIELLIKNPRLTTIKNYVPTRRKIKYLMENGAQMSHIRSNVQVLLNIPFEDMEARTRKLITLGLNKPLHIGILSRSKKKFDEITESFSLVSPMCWEVVAALPPKFSKKDIIYLLPKIGFLLSLGYSQNDIVEHTRILAYSLETVRKSYETLQPYYVDAVAFIVLSRFVTNRSLTGRLRLTVELRIANLLDCPIQTLMPLPSKERHLTAISYQILKCNLAFLTDVGFSKETVKHLPVILLQDPTVLRQAWMSMQANEFRSKLCVEDVLERWKSDDYKRLNFLQYIVERAANFSHVVVGEPTAMSSREDSVNDATLLGSTGRLSVVSDNNLDRGEWDRTQIFGPGQRVG